MTTLIEDLRAAHDEATPSREEYTVTLARTTAAIEAKTLLTPAQLVRLASDECKQRGTETGHRGWRSYGDALAGLALELDHAERDYPRA